MNSLRWVLAVNMTPLAVIQNPWYIVTVVCFTTGNRPDAVPLLFKYVLGEVERAQNQFKVPEVEAKRERLVLSRKFRDAIFKCGVVGGYSKVHTLLSQTNHRCNKLPPDNKRLGLSSRGYARGTTRHGTTKVSDKANARGLCDGFPAERLTYPCPSLKGGVRGSSEIFMERLRMACRTFWTKSTLIWVRTSCH
jgi:hypothetical protein